MQWIIDVDEKLDKKDIRELDNSQILTFQKEIILVTSFYTIKGRQLYEST